MLKPEIAKLLGEQVNAEFYASNVYLQLSAWCESQGLEGAALFFRGHSLEERTHMDKIFDYLCECGIPVTIGAIAAPPTQFANLMEVINAAYQHELKVSAMIKNIANQAFQAQDYTTFNFIEWFIAEQHEEEVLFGKILSKAKMLGFDGSPGQALHHMDNFLRAVEQHA
ncbi:ferritin [Thiomicrorhabdus cannonii]|uniref:ferritin n=1 Tax=Thiomicrorhabdus cannonii TaxID=2748011 RepID=UPI0015C16C62|nr:ferritin [Thiomicrorhabdus cannonii]